MHKLKQRVLHSPARIISSTERSVCGGGGGVRYRKIRQIWCCKYSFCFSDCNIQTAVIVSAETSQRLTTEPDNSSANTLSGRELHPGSCGPTTWRLGRITRQIYNVFLSTSYNFLNIRTHTARLLYSFNAVNFVFIHPEHNISPQRTRTLSNQR